ncbi:hypothetical protein GEMRC1_009854 [Eukaryota sp. GEM-RC1]
MSRPNSGTSSASTGTQYEYDIVYDYTYDTCSTPPTSGVSSSDYNFPCRRRILQPPQTSATSSDLTSSKFPKFQTIRQNYYIESKPDSFPNPTCECPKGSSCFNTSCLNFLVKTTCPSHCPAGSSCRNSYSSTIKSQLDSHKRCFAVEKFKDKGFGLTSKVFIKPNTFIMEYIGEVISNDLAQRRLAKLVAKSSPCYLLSLGHGLVIDAKHRGSFARFINHSCDPNCEVEVWTVDGLLRALIVSKRAIKAGEEITFDYKFTETYVKVNCFCGSHNCRKTLFKKIEVSDPYFDFLPNPLNFLCDLETN